MHDLRLIHTDPKPKNILLVSSEYVKLPGRKRSSSDETRFRCLPKSSVIKPMLIDFGSPAYDNHKHSSIVSTRHYRAPEVILVMSQIKAMVEDVQPLLSEIRESGSLTEGESLTKSVTQATKDLRQHVLVESMHKLAF